jgi:hypothetical protein
LPADDPTFSEDDQILSSLTDPEDVQAFENLIENAHRERISAADFVREEPKRTYRKAIRRTCLKSQKRSIKAIVSSIVRSLWDKPAADPLTAFGNITGPQQRFGGPQKDTPPANPQNGRG